jgi:hypothetical protein
VTRTRVQVNPENAWPVAKNEQNLADCLDEAKKCAECHFLARWKPENGFKAPSPALQ